MDSEVSTMDSVAKGVKWVMDNAGGIRDLVLAIGLPFALWFSWRGVRIAEEKGKREEALRKEERQRFLWDSKDRMGQEDAAKLEGLDDKK